MKHRPYTIIICLLFLLPGIAAFAPPGQDRPEVDLSIRAGYSSYYRQGHWTPVQVTLENTGGNLTGYIRVRTGNVGSLEQTTYRTPLDLPRDSRKQVFLYVSLESFQQRVQVEIVDQDDGVMARDVANLVMAGQSELLFAVVTDSPLGAVDMTELTPGAGRAQQTNWRIDNLPPLAEALAGLDVMLFHDVDTGTLGAEQSAAIAEWVRAGGHLIVTGGDPWQRTTAGFDDLLPVTLQGTVPADSLRALADYLRQPSDDMDVSATVTDSTPFPGAQTLVSLDDVPLIVRGSLGRGVVDFVAVDPQAEPLRSWSETGHLWYTLLATTGQQPSWSGGFRDWSMAREATLTTTSTALPTFLQLCGFLGVYILLIGPINYLVLKRLRRRELAWFSIPVLILVFSVLAYRVGFNLRGNVPTVNRLTVVNVTAGQDEAQVTGLIGVQSPRRSTYDVVVERGYTLRTLPDIGVGLNVATTITEATRFSADDVPIDAGTIASFVASGSAPAPQLEAQATWFLDYDAAPRVAGEVTNTTDLTLEDAVVLVKGESRWLGTLEPGEVTSFEIVLGPQDPGPVSAGSPTSQYTPAYGSSWYRSSGSPGWCFSYEGLALTINDVMHNEPFSCSSGRVSSREQEIRRRYRLLSALAVDYELSGGRGSGVYLFAWHNGGLIDVELTGKPQAEEDTSLYVFELPVRVQALNPLVDVPPSLTTWTLYPADDTSATSNITPVRFQVSANNHAVFQFMPLPDIRLEDVEELLLNFQGQGPLIVELWDWRDAAWTEISLNPDDVTTTIRNPARFIGPETMVNIRVSTRDATSFNQVDYVKLGYRGHLGS